MLSDGLVLGGTVPLRLVMLLLMPIAVEGVCPHSHCFSGLPSLGGTVPLLLVMLLLMPIAVEGVCPHCFSGLPSCTYGSNRKCPADATIAENIAHVAAVSSATAIAGGKFLKMPGVLAQRYLRMFTSTSLAALLRLCLKSTAGTDFELLATTTVHEAMQAIRNGQITAADVIVGFGGFVDTAADEAAERKLMNKAKTIAEARDARVLEAGLSYNADQCGPWLYLWAKISTFVVNRTMAVTSVVIETGAGKSPSTVLAKVAVFEDEREFFEALNLFTMWTTALGLASAVCVASFLQDFVYDTMRRGYIWQFAAVLFLLVLRHLEDSEGRLTFTNAAFQVHLSTLLREVEELMAVQHMEVDDFFRPPPAAAGRGGGGESTATTAKWNGKFSASATATCHAFNGGRDHQADHLLPDGTCRYKHACDKWVSDQGPSNHCFGAHPRAACTNPHRCDAEQQWLGLQVEASVR